MTDPIQHLRELLAKASLPPNEATAELIRALRLLSLPVVLSGDGDGKLRLHWVSG